MIPALRTERQVGAPTAIRAIRALPVRVPLKEPYRTARGTKYECHLVLTEVWSDDGIVGRAIASASPWDAVRIASLLESAELPAGEGIVEDFGGSLRDADDRRLARSARAVLDMAVWDGRARREGLPLAGLLGGTTRPTKAYGVAGMRGVEATARDAEKLASLGFVAIKVQIGYPTLREDLAVLDSVRRAVGPGVDLMADYDQSLDRSEAIERSLALDDEGLLWVEDPIRWDDFIGQVHLARQITTPIQGGVDMVNRADLRAALDIAGASNVRLDVQKIGGVTGWMGAVSLAADRRVSVSSHLSPELSAHLLAASPITGWLEWCDWWNPILEDPLTIADGRAAPSVRPGSGIEWDRSRVARYRI